MADNIDMPIGLYTSVDSNLSAVTALSVGYLSEVESRTQGSRPRTQKKSETKAKDSPSRGQGPRTQAQVFSKKKKKIAKIFSGDLQLRKTKNVFANFPRGFWRFPTRFQRYKK